MTKNLDLSITISYRVIDMDPGDVAMKLARQIELKLKEHLPSVGIAFGNLIDGDGSNPIWLDPDE